MKDLKQKIDYQEIWKVKKTSFGGYIGEELLCVLANGHPLYVADGLAVEGRKVGEEELKNKLSKKQLKSKLSIK